MELREAIRLLRAVAPSLVFERPHAEAFRVVLAEVERLAAEHARLRDACARDDHEIGQVLGRVLGYPRYADDPASFPGATDADGVATGPHVAATLAMEAAERIGRLTAERDALAAAARLADEFLDGTVSYGLARREKHAIREAFREVLAGLDAAPAERGIS